MSIENENGQLVDRIGPVMQSWQDGGAQIMMVMEENNLTLNMNYIVNITVSTAVGQTYTSLTFGAY